MENTVCRKSIAESRHLMFGAEKPGPGRRKKNTYYDAVRRFHALRTHKRKVRGKLSGTGTAKGKKTALKDQNEVCRPFKNSVERAS